MNTSSKAIETLQQALTATNQAQQIIDNLIADHDYQDVASLVTQAAQALLDGARLLMESQDEAALDALGRADDYLDAVYEIIDGETDED
jgi:pyruvate-formate lyase